MTWVSVTAKESVHVEEGNLLPAANTRDNELSEKKKTKKDQPADNRNRLRCRESREDSRPLKFQEELRRVYKGHGRSGESSVKGI